MKHPKIITNPKIPKDSILIIRNPCGPSLAQATVQANSPKLPGFEITGPTISAQAKFLALDDDILNIPFGGSRFSRPFFLYNLETILYPEPKEEDTLP